MALSFEDIYSGVPADQREALRRFRQSERQSTIEVHGRRWRYVSSGRGVRTVIFLPGAFAGADIWLRPIVALERDYRVLAVAASLEEFDPRRFCDAVLAIADHEGVDRFTVVGMSYGGGAAQFLLADHPDRVEQAVLSHCAAATPHFVRYMGRLRRTLALIPAPVFNWALRRPRSLRYDSPWGRYTTAYVRELSAQVDKSMFRRLLDQTIEGTRAFSHDAAGLAAWPGRILIVTSRDDPASFPGLHRLTARYPRAKVHVFDEGGHWTVLLFPDHMSEVLQAFLRGDP